jgi:K+-sensing histidine kinase KdpD
VNRRKTPTERYIVAIAVVVAAFALRFGLHDSLGNRIPFAFFTLSTLIAAWYGGLGPGMFAAVAGLVLADMFFFPPHSAEGLGETERTSIGIYAMTNTLIVVLFWHLHNRLRDAEDALRKMQGDPSGDVADSAPHAGTPGEVRPL